MSPPTKAAPRTGATAAPVPPRGRGRLWGGLVLVVLLLGAAVWVVGFTGVLGVKNVTVTGVTALSAEQVRAAAAVPDRQPLARVDLAAVSGRVSALAGVERVAVARSWPGTVRITVTERRGVAVVQRGDGIWLVDPGGVVFQRVAARPRGVPLLAIAGVGPDDPATRSALAALLALPAPVVAQVVKIAAPAPEQVTLVLTGKRTVLWGGADESAAKAAALTALLPKPARVYDVSTPSVVTTR
jgi:cell division protein FtsQ